MESNPIWTTKRLSEDEKKALRRGTGVRVITANEAAVMLQMAEGLLKPEGEEYSSVGARVRDIQDAWRKGKPTPRPKFSGRDA